MATEIAHMRSHSNGWDSLCVRKSLHTLVPRAFVEVTFIFLRYFYIFVLCSLSSWLPPGSVWMMLPEKMPFWCAVIAAIPNSLAVAIVCSCSLRRHH